MSCVVDRLAQPRPQGSACQELQDQHFRVRQDPRKGTLHLPLRYVHAGSLRDVHTDILSSEPLPKGTVAPASAQGQSKLPYTFKASQLETTPLAGGSVKIVDSSNFNVSKTIAMAEVTIEPGHIRELHWHPTQDEWSYFLYVCFVLSLNSAQYLTCDIGKELVVSLSLPPPPMLGPSTSRCAS